MCSPALLCMHCLLGCSPLACSHLIYPPSHASHSCRCPLCLCVPIEDLLPRALHMADKCLVCALGPASFACCALLFSCRQKCVRAGRWREERRREDLPAVTHASARRCPVHLSQPPESLTTPCQPCVPLLSSPHPFRAHTYSAPAASALPISATPRYFCCTS